MELIHGPFIEKRREGSPENELLVLVTEDGRVPMAEIRQGRCPCRQCQKNGSRRMPSTWMFIRCDPNAARKNVKPGDPVWIATRPKVDLTQEAP